MVTNNVNSDSRPVSLIISHDECVGPSNADIEKMISLVSKRMFAKSMHMMTSNYNEKNW